MSETRRLGTVGPGLAGLVLVLGLYVGSYYALVGQSHRADMKRWVGLCEPNYSKQLPAAWDVGPAGNRRLASVFTPIHWLDRKLRPDTWKPRPIGQLIPIL